MCNELMLIRRKWLCHDVSKAVNKKRFSVVEGVVMHFMESYEVGVMC